MTKPFLDIEWLRLAHVDAGNGTCQTCRAHWPCRYGRVVAEIDALRAEVERLKTVLSTRREELSAEKGHVSMYRDEHIKLAKEIERLRAALQRLVEYQPGEGPEELFNTDNPMYEAGDENALFFSEAYLYTLVGKDIARSLLALIRSCQT